jgi:DNA-directed RNA polymerase alpha subunit
MAAGIETTSQLTEMTIKDVEALEGLGKKSVEDIEKSLAKQGLGLKE